MRDAVLIGLLPANPIQQLVERQLAMIVCGNEERQVFNHFDTLITMVAIGLGSAVIPSFAMPACQRYQVRADLLSQLTVSAGFYRMARMGHGKAFYSGEFTSMLTTMLPQMAANEGQPA